MLICADKHFNKKKDWFYGKRLVFSQEEFHFAFAAQVSSTVDVMVCFKESRSSTHREKVSSLRDVGHGNGKGL